MPRILLANSPLSVDVLRRYTGLPAGAFHGPERGSPRLLLPGTPYAVGEAFTAADSAILADLAPAYVTTPLARLCRDCGGQSALALAEAVHQMQSPHVSVLDYVSAGSDVIAGRLGHFASAAETSQQAILDYHRAARAGRNAASARQAVFRANHDLSHRFRLELAIAHRRMSPRYRTLSSTDARLAALIRHTRKASRLDVASRFESGKLAKLARASKYLGNGLVAFDFGSRILDIRAEYESGGDWGKRCSSSRAVLSLP